VSRFRWRRERAVPVPDDVALARGERVLATARAGESTLVLTSQRLLVPGETDEGRAWHLVDRGRWDPGTDTLSVTWVDHAPAGRWVLTEAGGVPDAFHERVQASIVLVEEVVLDRARRARVVLRKDLASDRILAQTIVGTRCDPDDPELVAATEAAAARLAEQVGREP
jgi:hypothetical protein